MDRVLIQISCVSCITFPQTLGSESEIERLANEQCTCTYTQRNKGEKKPKICQGQYA